MGKRSPVPRHIRLTHDLLDSPAYQDLNLASRALLVEFSRICVPNRNGSLSISHRNAREKLKVSDRAATNAFRSLADHGFIELKKGHSWRQRKAREWRLTCEQNCEVQATDDWKKWVPGKPVF